jgi:hypothetical protein
MEEAYSDLGDSDLAEMRNLLATAVEAKAGKAWRLIDGESFMLDGEPIDPSRVEVPSDA